MNFMYVTGDQIFNTTTILNPWTNVHVRIEMRYCQTLKKKLKLKIQLYFPDKL